MNKPINRNFQAVLFDFDGTLSLIREGWQLIMYSYFTEVLAEVATDMSRAEVWDHVREFVDRLTGEQTIYQCIYLAEEMRRYGVPADPAQFKAEYNRRILRHIADRVAGLNNGSIPREELLVPGSRRLLEQLRQHGLTLYLASGTDHEYVVAEAQALGIADYFNGGIYGALDDYKKSSKEQVIRNLILPQIPAGETLLGFGDGFVEIENVKAVGGYAVGVASDEQRREGVDQWKRGRLLKAGADVIIGDYGCVDTLLEHLLGEGARHVSSL
ncbi:MAG: HAD family hydrolase [Firmicutes bacterium]|nr:HAD family hydrolase [Bacillota bacterium]